jgi:hypothetical protein
MQVGQGESSPSRGSVVAPPPFRILAENSKLIKKYNTMGRTMVIRFLEPSEEAEPMSYLPECITALTEHLVDKVPDGDFVGLTIRNTENAVDKAVWLSFRRCDHLRADVIMELLGKVIQSNARFGLSDRLEIHCDYVTLPSGNGKRALKTKGQTLNKLSHNKKSIVRVKSEVNSLAHALVFAMAQLNGDPDYLSYRDGYKMNAPVAALLNASGVDLSNGGGIEELRQFQAYLSDYKIIVYSGLKVENPMFSGNSLSAKRLYLLYDDSVTRVTTM